MATRLDHADETPQEVHEINVTPFIDVMLVLLVIFMATASIQTTSVPIDLPVSHETITPPTDPVVLTLDGNDGMFLGDRKLEAGELAAALVRETGGDHDRRIFLSADRNNSYGKVMAAMDQVRAAGFVHVALTALPAETP